MGRMSVIESERRRKAFTQLLKDGTSVRDACASVGVTVVTGYKWKKMTPDLNVDIKWKGAELVEKVKGGMSPRQAAIECGVSYSSATAHLRKAGVKWEKAKPGPKKKNVRYVTPPQDPVEGTASTEHLEKFCAFIAEREKKGYTAVTMTGEEYQLVLAAKLGCQELLRSRYGA